MPQTNKTVYILQVDDSEGNLLQVLVDTDDPSRLVEQIEEKLYGDLIVRCVPWDVVSPAAALATALSLIHDIAEEEDAVV